MSLSHVLSTIGCMVLHIVSAWHQLQEHENGFIVIHRCLHIATKSRTLPCSSLPILCVSLGVKWATRSRPSGLASTKGFDFTRPSASYGIFSPGWLRCSMYAVGGELNGGPPSAASLVVGNSRHIRLPWGAGASNCDIRIAQSGRLAGFIAQKNWAANKG